jgi:hypothetical protein
MRLLDENKDNDAYELFKTIAEKIAEEKWLPKRFSISHSIKFLLAYCVDQKR